MQNKMHIFSYWIGEKCKLLTFACIFFQINENLCKSLCFISMFLVIIQLTQWCFGNSGIPRPLEAWRGCIFKAPSPHHRTQKSQQQDYCFGWAQYRPPWSKGVLNRGSLPGKFVKMLKSKRIVESFKIDIAFNLYTATSEI